MTYFKCCLYLLIGAILTLTACRSDSGHALPDVDLQLRFVRTDSLMQSAAYALQDLSLEDPYAVYDSVLRPQREFWYEMIGLDRLVRGRQLSEGQRDSLIARQMLPLLADSSVLGLMDTIARAFPPGYDFVGIITPPLKRLIYHFPELELPVFCTHINGYDPSGDPRLLDQTLPTPHYFSFGLHYFLGAGFDLYPPNIPAFVRRRFAPEYMDVVMVAEIAEGLIPPEDLGRQPTLLDGIIRAGIVQYFIKEMLPQKQDSMLLYYSSEQMEWANYYEARIYKELIPDLFSSDIEHRRQYLSETPFSGNLSRESAPRIGVFAGWKIVTAYMHEHPDTKLSQLVEMQDYERIFREARYKP